MNIHSKSINANDLDGVYDYFDNVVNQMIRNELDTENFPTLQEFAGEFAVLIDRLDALCDDINPRVEEYLESKAEEEKLRLQLEELQAKLGSNREARRHKFGGSDGDESLYEGGIYDSNYDDGKDERRRDGAYDSGIYDSDSPYGASSFHPENTSAVEESHSFIDFSTDIEEMMSDDDDDNPGNLVAPDIFNDTSEILRAHSNDTIDDEDLMKDLERVLDPMAIFSGQSEMDAKGDHYDELNPETDLYDEDGNDRDSDDDDNDEFNFGFPSDIDDYKYEDDDDDDDNDRDYFSDSGSLFDEDEADWGASNDYRGNYRNNGTGRLGGTGRVGLDEDDWDEGDDLLNIDQLLSSANMTI